MVSFARGKLRPWDAAHIPGPLWASVAPPESGAWRESRGPVPPTSLQSPPHALGSDQPHFIQILEGPRPYQIQGICSCLEPSSLSHLAPVSSSGCYLDLTSSGKSSSIPQTTSGTACINYLASVCLTHTEVMNHSHLAHCGLPGIRPDTQ